MYIYHAQIPRARRARRVQLDPSLLLQVFACTTNSISVIDLSPSPARAVLQSLLCANLSYMVHPIIPSPFPVACTTSCRDRDVLVSKLPANSTRISVAPRVITNSAPRPLMQRFNASTSERILVCKSHIERRINASISYGTGKGIARHALRWPAILRVRFSESGRLSK
jgi:hypothetical protein